MPHGFAVALGGGRGEWRGAVESGEAALAGEPTRIANLDEHLSLGPLGDPTQLAQGRPGPLGLIAALGTAFLAGPTLSGETESGIALAVLARPIRRSHFLLGKWLGLVAFGSAFVIVAGLAQCLVVQATVDYWPPEPAAALAFLAAQTVVLLTLALLLSTAVSPMASGVVTVGLFGSTWIAGVVGGIGAARDNASVERVGTISRMLLPTDACGGARCTRSRTRRRSSSSGPRTPSPSRS